MSMTCGREIWWWDGALRYSIQGYEGTPEALLSEMISNLIEYDSDTFIPRIKWYQFWLEKFNTEVTDEYIRQTNLGKDG